MLSLGPTPEEINARLIAHMEAARTRDKVSAVVLVTLASLFMACFFGFRQSSEFDFLYLSTSWDWRLGLPAGIVPWFFVLKLHRWLRARRSRRFIIG